MTKHTPGPWYLNVSDDLSEYAVCAESRGKGFGSSVLVVTERVTVKPLEHAEAMANAALVSAAPDMLAACMEIANGYSTRASEMARAAIAKATGETT